MSAPPGDDDSHAVVARAPYVPRLLAVTAAWCWRLLLVAGAVYVGVWVLTKLALVVVAFLAAVFLTAILRPLVVLLRRYMPDLVATWLTILVALVVIGGIGVLVWSRAAAGYSSLVDQMIHTVRHLQSQLTGPPLHLSSKTFSSIGSSLVTELEHNRAKIASLAVTGAGYLLEFATGFVLCLFITFFFVYQGERIWHFVVSAARGPMRGRLEEAGHAAWYTVSRYVLGTATIAVIHGTVIGIALFLIGVPLVVPLAVIVFVGSFIPIVGALVAGALAVLVTFGTQGWVAGLILLGVLVLENQLEGHLMQPLIVGRYVHLHPLAIGLALAVGAVLAGVIGAIIAVPVTAAIYRAWPILTADPAPPPAASRAPDEGEGGAAEEVVEEHAEELAEDPDRPPAAHSTDGPADRQDEGSAG